MNKAQKAHIELHKLTETYLTKRLKLMAQVTRGWKACRYPGCDVCIEYDGLVPADSEFAERKSK